FRSLRMTQFRSRIRVLDQHDPRGNTSACRRGPIITLTSVPRAIADVGGRGRSGGTTLRAMSTATAPTPALPAQPTAPRTFSGIQPSGVAHLGNDLGAIRNYVRLQNEYDAIYCIVDYHALTSTHDPDVLRSRTRDMAASLLALG